MNKIREILKGIDLNHLELLCVIHQNEVLKYE